MVVDTAWGTWLTSCHGHAIIAVMELPVDQTIKNLLDEKLKALEERLTADVLWFYGPIQEGSELLFLRLIEQLAEDEGKKERRSVCHIDHSWGKCGCR